MSMLIMLSAMVQPVQGVTHAHGYACAHIHAHIYTRLHKQTLTHTHAYTHTCLHIHTLTHTHAYTYTCLHIHAHTRVRMRVRARSTALTVVLD